jgi:phosphoglycolate phosphatase-like HAD superfamily hydrolase
MQIRHYKTRGGSATSARIDPQQFFKMLPKGALLFEVLGFDMDGTLIDSKPLTYWAGKKAFERLGIEPPTQKQWYAAFDQGDHFRVMYRNLGVPEKYLKGEGLGYEFASLWHRELTKLEGTELPKLVPGARKTIELLELVVGRKNMHIISMRDVGRTERILKKHNLIRLFNRILGDSFDKTCLLQELKNSYNGERAAYFSDIVSDGLACKNSDVTFGIVMHRYGYMPPAQLLEYAKDNPDAILIKGVRDIPYALINKS